MGGVFSGETARVPTRMFAYRTPSRDRVGTEREKRTEKYRGTWRRWGRVGPTSNTGYGVSCVSASNRGNNENRVFVRCALLSSSHPSPYLHQHYFHLLFLLLHHDHSIVFVSFLLINLSLSLFQLLFDTGRYFETDYEYQRLTNAAIGFTGVTPHHHISQRDTPFQSAIFDTVQTGG